VADVLLCFIVSQIRSLAELRFLLLFLEKEESWQTTMDVGVVYSVFLWEKKDTAGVDGVSIVYGLFTRVIILGNFRQL
jgi:hypothetical protein